MPDSIIPIVDPGMLFEGAAFDSVSRYRLLRRLGEGGMGDVWLAERVSAGEHTQKVAIKFLRGQGGSGKSLAAEALRMSHLIHDNIVPFLDSGRDPRGRFFVVMAFIDGLSLSGVMELLDLTLEAAHQRRISSRMPDQLVGFVLFMVLRALHYAHHYDFGNHVVGLVHRDVSPGNILINRHGGFVKLTDFGVAVPQDSGEFEIAGKVPYMSPEVLTGEHVGPASDIYSLGIVAYELLTGFNPNVMPSQLSTIIGAITGVMLALEKPLHPPNAVVAGVDERLSAIVAKMLLTDRKARYQSAEEVMADLTGFLYSRGIGPTAGSLASYLTLISSEDPVLTPRIRRTLQFLQGDSGELEFRPKWELSASSQAALDQGENPSRF